MIAFFRLPNRRRLQAILILGCLMAIHLEVEAEPLTEEINENVLEFVRIEKTQSPDSMDLNQVTNPHEVQKILETYLPHPSPSGRKKKNDQPIK